jgi:hypothetical protein
MIKEVFGHSPPFCRGIRHVVVPWHPTRRISYY